MGDSQLSIVVLTPHPQLLVFVLSLKHLFDAQHEFLLHIQLVYTQHVLHVSSLDVFQFFTIDLLGPAYFDKICKTDLPHPHHHIFSRPFLDDLHVSLKRHKKIIRSEYFDYLFFC